MVFEENNLIFCGAETHPAKNHDQIELLLCGHIRALRGHESFRNSWIICFFESNLGLEAAHMARKLFYFLFFNYNQLTNTIDMVKNERRCWVMVRFISISCHIHTLLTSYTVRERARWGHNHKRKKGKSKLHLLEYLHLSSTNSFTVHGFRFDLFQHGK